LGESKRNEPVGDPEGDKASVASGFKGKARRSLMHRGRGVMKIKDEENVASSTGLKRRGRSALRIEVGGFFFHREGRVGKEAGERGEGKGAKAQETERAWAVFFGQGATVWGRIFMAWAGAGERPRKKKKERGTGWKEKQESPPVSMTL